MNTIPWYKSNTLRGLALAIVLQIVAWLGLTESINDASVEQFIDMLLGVIEFGALLFAGWARARQPTPPITQAAAVKTAKLQQGGFIRAFMLAVMLAIGIVSMIGLTACTHTQQALRNADSPSDYALVFLEGYDGALKTANQLRASGALSGSNLERVRQAELKAWPLVQKIDPLRRAYEQTQSAEDAAALQLAIDNAIREAAEFVRVVRELRSGSTARTDESEQWIIERAERLS